MALFDVYPLYNVTPVRGKGVFVYDDKDGLDGIISKTDITQALASLD